MRVRKFVGFMDGNARTHLHCLARIVGAVVVDDLHCFDVMSPDGDSASTCRLAVVVMASILNNQTDIVLSGECNCLLVIRGVRGIHRVANVVANGTRSTIRQKWVAAIIGEVLSHDRAG